MLTASLGKKRETIPVFPRNEGGFSELYFMISWFLKLPQRTKANPENTGELPVFIGAGEHA